MPLHAQEVATFNALKYTKKLEGVGIAREQAEAHVQVIAEIVEDDVATKNDLKDLENRLVIKLSAILGGMITLAIAVITALSRIK